MSIRLKLAHLLLRGTEHEVWPVGMTEDMRAAVWFAQAEHVRKKRNLDVPDHATSTATLQKLNDPDQRVQDHVAFEAMRAVATGRAKILMKEPGQ